MNSKGSTVHSSGTGRLWRLLLAIFMFLLFPAVCLAQESGAPERWVIEAVGTQAANPDTVHLLMKMEQQAGMAAVATVQGEAQLGEFLAAVDKLNIPGLAYRVSNNLFTSPPGMRNTSRGIVYARNIVFTLDLGQGAVSESQLESVVARLEDLGAKYNSHCVTCIGTG